MRLSLSEGEVNAGHHLYMGGHADEMEQLLRDAFPGQSEDFYNYGKWAGGAMNLMNSKRSQWMKDLKLMTTLNKPI